MVYPVMKRLYLDCDSVKEVSPLKSLTNLKPYIYMEIVLVTLSH